MVRRGLHPLRPRCTALVAEVDLCLNSVGERRLGRPPCHFGPTAASRNQRNQLQSRVLRGAMGLSRHHRSPEERDAVLSNPLHRPCPRHLVRPGPPLPGRLAAPHQLYPRLPELPLVERRPLQGLRRPPPPCLGPDGGGLATPGPRAWPRDPLPQLGAAPQG